MFKFMNEINLEFIDRTEEWNEAKHMRKFMEDWSSLIRDGSAYCNTINDSSEHYFESLDDVDILEPNQISLTFKYDYDLIENE